ncbi:unnamed protein product [Lymnaea stagnalis]|uniref:Centrosomal protein of 70 kDa n=1 Tax=Lymnaea stagnalis TaxID=6523 RepID=A0AAV2HS35_LYMST
MADFGYQRRKLDYLPDDDFQYSDTLQEDSKEEIREWMDVNRKLRRHGMESVRVFSSQDVALSSGRYICIDLEASQSLRTAVISLISEIEKKENVMQEVLLTNSQLQKKASQLSNEVETANAKAKDIKVMLECSRARVQELEEDRSRSNSRFAEEGERLKNTKSSMASSCRQLEAKVAEQEKELERLHREVLSYSQEEERRNQRNKKAFTEFKHRPYRANSAVDQKLLDLIDSYEKQIHILQKELDDNRLGEVSSDFEDHSQSNNNVKDINKLYEKQLREKEKKIKLLEEENKMLKRDFGSKYEIKDYRLQSLRVKKLENLLQLHNISIPGEKASKDPFIRRKKFSTKLEDLEYLPLEPCHHYLKEICKELETENLDCMIAEIQELKREGHSSNRFHEYCKELADIVGLNEGNHRNRSCRHEKNPATLLCDSNMRYYLEVVENWHKDISALGELQEVINELLDKVVPWLKARMNQDHSVEEMVELLERVIHAEKNEGKKVMMEDVSRTTLEHIVSHFQTLFDIPKISGVFPRMNEIYRVLGESKNVMNTLKSLLGLEADIHTSALVDAVGRLCHVHNSTTAKQLKKLLQTDDLNGVVRRLEEHSDFFPAFHGVMHKLFEILGVDKMDEILPAVRALKLLAK